MRFQFTRKQKFMSPGVTTVKPYELELSIFFVFVFTGVYIAYEILSEPRGGHPLGHWLGIFGATMMLMTEVLYSVRKRTSWLNWAGPVRYWLSFHIFTGIVGPFLILMHTGLVFRGLAGISFVLMLIVVGSGFIGRYLYTALPRTLSGVTASRQELEREAKAIEATLSKFEVKRPFQEQKIITELQERSTSRNPLLTLFGRSYYQWRYQRKLRRALRQLDQIEAKQQANLAKLLSRKRELERQAEIIETARRLLRVWHILHIPFGMTLFFSMTIHIIATVYFRAGIFK